MLQSWLTSLPTGDSNVNVFNADWILANDTDGALLKVFGATGVGLFPAPAAIKMEIRRQYGVRPLGTLDGVHERFYAISVERKLKNPAVVAISASARTGLFSCAPPS